jgi:peptide/nickel transport system substrate-binding protein/oligopeptide transport system substrate-binding protein
MRVLDPKTRSPNTGVFEKIAGAKAFREGKAADLEGVRVKDGGTLEIRLEKPFSPFLYLLTMTPAYVVPEEEVRKWGPDFSSHPVGSGPFSLREWLPNRELRLEAREDYFAKRAKVRGIVYRIIPEDLTVLTEFELGNLDIVSIPASAIAKYRKDPKWKDYVESMKGVNTYYLGMNCSRPPFNNPELRRAMNYAIDRKKLLATFYEGRGRLAEGPVPDLLRTWEISYPYVYDPGKARAMIERLGLKGKTIDFYVNADQEVVDMAELIQAYMKDAGLEVRIRQLEWSAFKQAVNRGDADMFWLSWWADYPDPENFLFPLFHSSNLGPAGNRARYVNTEVDRAIEHGQAAQDAGERNRYYGEAEQMIVNDAPWVFFWHKTDFTLRQPWIRNYRMYPIYSIDKGTAIELAIE